MRPAVRDVLLCSAVLLWSVPALTQMDTAGERTRVLTAANRYLKEAPITVTASRASRSGGGPHDYADVDDHRRALTRLSVQFPALVAAYTLTTDQKYSAQAARHARAWFISRATRMSPSLRYGRAIDTIHLIEVARGMERLDGARGWSRDETIEVRRWFADYLDWLTTDQSGTADRDATDHHGTCWVAQVAAFAHYTNNEPLMRDCRTRFKTVLLDQMAADGSFPRELARPARYADSLFNLEAMGTICQILSTPEDDLWTFERADGRGMRKAMGYMAPYIRDKRKWPGPADLASDANWPMRQSSLLFAGVALKEPSYLELWSSLPADSEVEDVIRSFFIRQPLLWFD